MSAQRPLQGRTRRLGTGSMGGDRRGFAFTFTALILVLAMISSALLAASFSGPLSLTEYRDGDASKQIFQSSLIGAAASASKNETSPLGAARLYMDTALGPLYGDHNLEPITPEEGWGDLAVEENSSAKGYVLALGCGGCSLLFEVEVLSLTDSPSASGVVYTLSFSYSARINGVDISGGAPEAFVNGQRTDVIRTAAGTYIASFATPGNVDFISFSTVDPSGVTLAFGIPLGG